MVKRLLIGGSLAIVCAGLLLVFILRSGDKFHEAFAAEAVPANAIAFVDKVDYKFFSQEFSNISLIWKDFIKYPYFHDFDSVFNLLNKNIASMPLLERRLDDAGLSLSLHLLGKNKLSAVYYFSLGDHITPNEMNEEMETALSEGVLLNQRRYEAVDIMDVSFNNSNSVKGFTYAIKDGLLIASRSSMLVEDAIRNLNSGGGIYNEQGFRKVEETAGKYVFGNIYVNYPLLNQLFYPLLNSNSFDKLSGFAEIGRWGEFDIDIREDVLLLNGMTYAEDSLKGWLNLFRGQSPVKLEATSFIPSNVTDFMALGISDIKLFKENFKKELSVRGSYQQFIQSEKESEKLIGASAYGTLLDLINDEIAWFTMEDGKAGRYSEVVMFEVRSRSEAQERLTGWLSVYASEKGEKAENYISKYALDDQTSFNIYNLPEKPYKLRVINKFLKSNFAFYDNYVIFSDSKEAISRTIYQNILHKTLENEATYEEVNNLLSSKANLTYLVRPEYFFARQKALLDVPVLKQVEEMAGTLKKMTGLIVQFANEGDMFYSNISVKYASALKEKAMTVWESLLDSMAIIKPYLVTNHYTSEKEIVVQDATNSLHLVNSTGRVLWQLKLDGPVLSEIYQVDYYKNGKLQYMFNTASGIHLLDRNGNYVERYPVKFRSNATNGIVLFDYDKSKDYRIFVAGEDRQIYVYNLEGNIIPGWTFRKSEGEVLKPVQHFRVKENDYILFSDPIRSYILDRKGKERIKLMDQMVISRNNIFYLDMNIAGSSPRFVTSDTAGNVVGVDLTGKFELILEHSATPNHFFRIKDLDQDGKPEYIFADKNDLEVIDFKGKRLFSFKLKGDISTLPDIYEFSASDLKIGLTDAERNLIYLLNSDGTLYEGFPLEGNTRYSIGYFAGSDSRFNLIVGSQNGFLYNYSIE